MESIDRTAVAKSFVRNYAIEHLDKSDKRPDFEVYVVWQCCILGNYKWLISTTLDDGMYYEVTFDVNRGGYYFDAYKKWENRAIPLGVFN